ncbi:MAG: hypothetical protein ACKPBG_15120 [Actinomycetota bacterium]
MNSRHPTRVIDDGSSLPLMIGRALARRCPRCGDRRAWFDGWFRQGSRCRACGVRRTRQVDGHELGSMTVALVANISLIVLVLGVAIALTVPDVPVLTVTLALSVAAVIVPIATWPLSHTVWMALDLRFRPLEAGEISEAATWTTSHETPVPIEDA